MTEDWIKPPPPLHTLRCVPPLSSRRLAQGGSVSFPRPRRTPLGHLAWWGGWLLVWTAWWFAAGVMVQKDLQTSAAEEQKPERKLEAGDVQ